ncbi:MAG: metal ABC transporter permease [Clostridiales bacterium]|nr:metal ABC transporter permease [Clostridia bacterium]MCR4563178.1 metal ABC transporter permease [Clostridiales bacterium]
MDMTFSQFLDYFALPFIQYAFIVGIIVSLCSSLLGVSLVLKRYSMIGDGLSHVGFGTLAVASALNLTNKSMFISIPVVVLAAFLLLRLNESSKIKGDSAIALISTSALAIGYTMSYTSTNSSSVDVCNFMFGSLLTIKKSEVLPSILLSVVVLVIFVFFYNRIFAVTFDETFAKATGTKSGLYNMLIAFLTAVTIVMGMKIMGTLLISALIIFPALTSMRLCKSFRGVVISSAVISIICCITGIIAGIVFGTPTGSSIVLCNLLLFLVFSIIASCIKRKKAV